MCAVDGAEPWDFFNEETRRARKAYRCEECGREIERGEQHQYAVGLCDGSFEAHRTCAHCVAASSWLSVECRGYLIGGVLEELTEHWGHGSEYQSMWLARAIVGMRRKWRTRRGALMQPLPEYQRPASAEAA
jgi:hypothetical protein